MMPRRAAILGGLAAAAAFYVGLPAVAKSGPCGILQALDADNDGTLDIAEAKTAAGSLFDRLDRDHDGTLDKRELRDRLSAKEFAAADLDKDGTLSKDEYLMLVERRFRAADLDNDGTLTCKELRTKAGRALLRLLK